MLTLEEAGLESTHIIRNCEPLEVVDEDPEVGVLMSEWSCNFLALNSNLSTSLLLGVDVHSASRAAIDAPVLSPSHASHLRDLAIGDRGAVLQQSSERPDGVIWHQYSVVFSYRNIFVFLSAGTEATSEELIDWLTDIAHLQYTKLQSMPLAAEFLADW
jgi:hypothetical protein